MTTLTDDVLEKQGVTKGARHKIIVSLNKLLDRPKLLKRMHDEMTGDKDSVRNALTEIKWMLTTPIKPALNEDDGNNAVAERGTGGNNAAPGPIGSNRFQQADENSKGDMMDQQQKSEDDLPAAITKVIRKGKSMTSVDVRQIRFEWLSVEFLMQLFVWFFSLRDKSRSGV
jgi:hypothetical protein